MFSVTTPQEGDQFGMSNGGTDEWPYVRGTGANDAVPSTDCAFDSLGRITEIKATSPTAVDFVRAYDYNGNPKYTEYVHKSTQSELYGTQAGGSPEGPAHAFPPGNAG